MKPPEKALGQQDTTLMAARLIEMTKPDKNIDYKAISVDTSFIDDIAIWNDCARQLTHRSIGQEVRDLGLRIMRGAGRRLKVLIGGN